MLASAPIKVTSHMKLTLGKQIRFNTISLNQVVSEGLQILQPLRRTLPEFHMQESTSREKDLQLEQPL